jgi:hypothetical protein
MKTLEWINAAFELQAVGFGAVVLRGVLRGSLRRRWVIRLLMCSLIASLVGLFPLTSQLTAIQKICMMSVYCSCLAVIPLLKHNLSEVWRPIFIVSTLAVLYLSVVAVLLLLLKHAPLLATTTAMEDSAVHSILWLFDSCFAVVVILAVKRCRS